MADVVTFEGTVGASMGRRQRVRVTVPRGSEAHAFALSLSWLHEVPDPSDVRVDPLRAFVIERLETVRE